jgi:DNA-binding MltR family transcriptional regulator
MPSKPAYRKAFQDFLDSSPDFWSIPAMEEEFYLGTDRPAVILQASNADDIVRRVLRAKMRRNLSKDAADRIFEGNGPLANFSNRVAIAHALGLIGNVFRHDLDLIRELRNGFAHVRLPMTLETPQIAEMCKHLKLPDNEKLRRWPTVIASKLPFDADADYQKPRARFIMSCHTISVHLLLLEDALRNGKTYALP